MHRRNWTNIHDDPTRAGFDRRNRPCSRRIARRARRAAPRAKFADNTIRYNLVRDAGQ
jgi:hypothetical protein